VGPEFGLDVVVVLVVGGGSVNRLLGAHFTLNVLSVAAVTE